MFFLSNKFTTAIIAAAGNGSRMGGVCKNKLLYKTHDIPVICHTVIAYSKATTISEIIVVTREENLEEIYDILCEYNLEKTVKAIIVGSDTRFKSIQNALDVVSKKTKYIAIADGARPFITPNEIDEVSNAAYKHKAAALCAKVYDTIKVKSADGFIEKTINRDNLLAMQTPQTFDFKLYKKAVTQALISKVEVTDDCMLMELINQKVYPVFGSRRNIKITTPEDIEI